MVTVAVALTLLALYQIGLGRIESPAVAENNSQVVVLRAQQYEFGPIPRAVLTGSSISGRLPTQTFADAGYPIANMGLDGLSAAFGLNVILEQKTLPATVLVEVNTIDKPLGQNGKTVDGVRSGFGYDLSRAYPPLRTESRPTTLLYSALRSRRNAGYTLTPEVVPITETTASGNPGPAPDVLIETERAIQQLLERDIDVLLVLFPTGSDTSEALAVGNSVSARLNIPLLDLTGLAEDAGFYTDGVHLTPPAADAVSTELARFMAARNAAQP